MNARGFTLLELLVVIAIIGLVLAVIPGFLIRDQPALELERAARQVGDGLRQTRSDAMVSNRERVFAIDVEARTFRPGQGHPLQQLEPGLEVGLLTARGELMNAQQGRIRFFPDGSSTGGRITLQQGGLGAAVAVDWLTGMVTIDGPGA